MLKVQMSFIPSKETQMVGLMSHAQCAVTSLAWDFSSNMGAKQATLLKSLVNTVTLGSMTSRTGSAAGPDVHSPALIQELSLQAMRVMSRKMLQIVLAR